MKGTDVAVHYWNTEEHGVGTSEEGFVFESMEDVPAYALFVGRPIRRVPLEDPIPSVATDTQLFLKWLWSHVEGQSIPVPLKEVIFEGDCVFINFDDKLESSMMIFVRRGQKISGDAS